MCKNRLETLIILTIKKLKMRMKTSMRRIKVSQMMKLILKK